MMKKILSLDRIVGLAKYPFSKMAYRSYHRKKEKTVKDYAKIYGCNVFVETGTYWGDMDKHVYKTFEYLASVEIQKFIYEKNLITFKNYSKLHLYCGDSTHQIPKMLSDIKAHFGTKKYKVVFWLDGHYSAGITGRGEKDTPILEELKGIKDANIGKCVILIDDARCFVHEGEYIEYPTLDYLKGYVSEIFNVDSFEVENDIIRIIV